MDRWISHPDKGVTHFLHFSRAKLYCNGPLRGHRLFTLGSYQEKQDLENVPLFKKK